MRKSVSKKKKFIFLRRIFFGVFFVALFFLSVHAASAQLTHTDVFNCTPSGSIPANAVPCPNAETPLVFGPYACAISTANPYCPAVNFTYCDDRKLVASCSGATSSGEYICQAGYGLVGGVCCKPDCSCAANTCIGSTCSDGCGGTCAGTKDCGQWCGRCSTVTPTTYVTWYDRTGGCDDDWFNQRSESTCDTRCYTPNNCAGSTCIGSTCNDGCKVVAGTKVCACAGNGCASSTCSGSQCWDNCQWQEGTKLPSYGAPACFFVDTGQTCGSSNCGTTINTKTAKCMEIDNNGCASPNVVANSLCGASCQDQTTTCPSCSSSSSNWKEVAP